MTGPAIGQPIIQNRQQYMGWTEAGQRASQKHRRGLTNVIGQRMTMAN